MPDRFGAAALLLVLVLPACASRKPDKPAERVICVSEKAAVGSRVRVRDGFVAAEYAPYYVVTKIHGPTRHCEGKPLPITARAVLESDWDKRP